MIGTAQTMGQRAPALRLLGVKEVLSMTRLSEAAIYRGMREGWFPRPHKVGPRAVRWHEAQLMDWFNGCPHAEYAPLPALIEGAAV